MTPRRLLVAALLCLIAIVSGMASAFGSAAQVSIRDVDTRAFPVVSLTATVSGKADPADISIQENGVPIRDPNIIELGSQAEKIDVVLVLDTSASMQGAPLASAVAAARSFVTSAPAGVRIGLLTFADKPTIVQRITSDHRAVEDALGKAIAAGNTSLFDAVAAGARMFSGTDQRNIVLLTDGGDTTSKATLHSAIGTARAAHATIFSIGLKTAETDVASLQRMSSATHGRYTATASGDLTAVYQQILTVLTSQFKVTYRSQARRGTTATLLVSALGASATYRLAAPGLPPTPAPSHAPSPQPVTPPNPLLSGAFGIVIALGLTFLAIYFVALVLLLPGVRARREREIARRVGVAARVDASPERPDRTIGTYLPTLVAVGDRLADAGGFTLSLEAKLERAGLPVTAGEIVVASGLSALFGAIVGGVGLHGVVPAVIVAIIFGVGPFGIIEVAARRRMKKIHAQLPDVLMILATSLRSGHSFLQGLDTVSKEAAQPAAKEFARVVAEVRLGRPMEEALNTMADRIGSEDFRWAVLAVNVQRQVGGNLAEVLDTVSETLREREAVRRQIDSLSAEGKLSLYIRMALPIFIGLWIARSNPSYMSPLFRTTGGLVAVVAGAVLMGIGYLWMRKIVNIDV
jgi:tight adherence protein B